MTVYESAAAAELYQHTPTDEWVKTPELRQHVDLTRRGVLHAVDRLAEAGVLEKRVSGPGVATRCRRIETEREVKSYKSKARSEPAGFHINNGYEVSSCSLSDSDSIGIHRLVAVAEYGIEAVSDRQVHHINGIPWDNRPENLLPLTESEHQRRERLRGSIERADDEQLAAALRAKGYSDAASEIERGRD
jgi:hypothetical protein